MFLNIYTKGGDNNTILDHKDSKKKVDTWIEPRH